MYDEAEADAGSVPSIFFFFFTLVTCPRRSLSLKLSGTRPTPTAARSPQSATCVIIETIHVVIELIHVVIEHTHPFIFPFLVQK